jgi:hypothetical protein
MIPSGTSGTYTATHHFQTFDVTGDIGAVRVAGGVASATLDLGFTAYARKIDNDNCGSHLEEITHPFAGAQMFDVPIQTTTRIVNNNLSF